jgi:hypothetical protein
LYRKTSFAKFVKMARTIFIWFIVFLLPMFLYNCQKIRSYPDVPVLNFKSFTYIDTTLTFTYADGDGNFGTNLAGDSLNNLYDMFLSMYQKKDTSYTIVSAVGTIPWDINSIPQPQGQNKTMRGDIAVSLRNTLSALQNFPDTFRFEFYIIDRADNRSKTVKTPDLYSKLLGKKTL